jgi:hypothetical protein
MKDNGGLILYPRQTTKYAEIRDYCHATYIDHLSKPTNAIVRNEYVLIDENGDVIMDFLKHLELGSWLQYQLEKLSKKNVLLKDGFKLYDNKVLAGIKYTLTKNILLNIKNNITEFDKLVFEYIIDYIISQLYTCKEISVIFITINNPVFYNKASRWVSAELKIFYAMHIHKFLADIENNSSKNNKPGKRNTSFKNGTINVHKLITEG